MKELLKQLEETCKKVVGQIKEIEMKVVNANNDIQSLTAQKAKMSAERDDIKKQLDQGTEALKGLNKKAQDEIEQRLRQIADKESALAKRESQLNGKENELNSLKDSYESKKRESDESKKRYDSLYADYMEKYKKISDLAVTLK